MFCSCCVETSLQYVVMAFECGHMRAFGFYSLIIIYQRIDRAFVGCKCITFRLLNIWRMLEFVSRWWFLGKLKLSNVYMNQCCALCLNALFGSLMLRSLVPNLIQRKCCLKIWYEVFLPHVAVWLWFCIWVWWGRRQVFAEAHALTPTKDTQTIHLFDLQQYIAERIFQHKYGVVGPIKCNYLLADASCSIWMRKQLKRTCYEKLLINAFCSHCHFWKPIEREKKGGIVN